MKSRALIILAAVILLLIPAINYGQAPNLGTSSSFALFTSAGAFDNTGTSSITGNIGSFTYDATGFPPGALINGAIFGPLDGLSATAAPDVLSAYGELSTVICGSTLVLPLAGQTLTPGVYCYGAAATLDGVITLNGEGNPDALFIIKIGGAFATTGGSLVKLINSASPNNVYWQIGGQFDLVDASVFKGNLIVDGAIHLLGTATLTGRGLSRGGAISTVSNIVILGAPPAQPTVTLIQPTCPVPSGTITVTAPTGTGMTYSIDGTTYTNTTGIFSGLAPGSYNVTAMDADGYVSPVTPETINAIPVPPTAPVIGIITQPTCTLATGSVDINGLPAGNWTLTRNPGGIITTGTGPTTTISGLNTNTYTFTVTDDVTLCTSVASFNAVIDAQPVTPTAPLVGTITQPTCSLATGSVILNGLPGTGTWTLTRNPGGITTTGTGTTTTISLLSTGTYTFTVLDGTSLCTSLLSADAVIDAQPVTPTAPLIGTITQPTCSLATGSVILNGLPGTGTWTLTRNPGGISTTGTGITTTISLLSTGTYTFTVADGTSLCTSLQSADAVIDAQPVTPTAPLIGTVTQPTCSLATGSVILNGLPGTGTWTLTRNPGGITTTGTGTTTTISLLSTGTYTFTVLDGTSLCTSLQSSDAVIDAQPVTPTAPLIGTITQPTCSLATGSVILNGLPGTGTWTLTRNPGGITTTGTGTTTTISLLSTGTYTFTVTDGTSLCTSLSSADAVIDAQPVTPIATASNNGPVCEGSSISLTGGPNGMTTYAWTGPGGYSSALQNPVVSSNATLLMAGTYSLIVTGGNGCLSIASTTLVTVNALPVALTGNTGPVCEGSPLSLTGGPVGMTTYAWTGQNGFSSALQNPLISSNATSLMAGIYTLIVTDGTGCISDPALTIVTVNPVPAAAAGSNTSICLNANAIIGAAPVPGNTYNWSSIPAGFTSSLANPLVTPLVTTTYTLIETVAASGCTNSNSVVVTVSLLPAPAAIAGPDRAICFNTSTQIGASAVAGSTYSWTSFPAGYTSTLPDPVVTPSVTTTYTIVETTTASGCNNINSVVVTVDPLPAATAGINRSVCLNTGTQIGGASTAGSTYAWTAVPAGFTSTLSNPTVTPAINTIFTVTETITATGCTNTNSVVVLVDPLPTAAAGADRAICLNANTVIGAASVAGNSYSWTSVPAGFISTLADPTVTPVVNTTYTVTEIITATGCTNTNSVVIAVNPLPAANAGADMSICLNTNAILGAVAAAGSTYSWTSLPSGFTSALANPTVTPLVSTTYTVIETVTSSGCTASNSVVVTVNPLPAPAGNITGTSPVCQGQTGVIYSVSAITDASSYVWTVPAGATITAGANSNSITVSFSAIATGGNISVIGNNSCGNGPISPNFAVVLNNCSSTDLGVATTADNTYPLIGRTVIFTVAAVNNGPGDVTGAVVSNPLLIGYTYVSSTVTAGTYDPSTGNWTIGSMLNGASETLTITATVNPSGDYTNTATITGNEPESDLANNTSTTITYPEDFFIPEGFSPDGDGINDLFIIRGIFYFPENSIVIFNRWGNKVYEANPYINTWDGRSIRGLRVGGDELPTGTYFYLLDLGDGSKVIKGTVYLNR
jgi:gliding motility-associated-like protein